MKRLYQPAAYTISPNPDNFWQSTIATPVPPTLEGEHKAEVAIIGAGFTGLNAALQLAEKHNIQATVIDSAWPGWGASGRNGGFACLGGTKLSNQKILSKFGKTDALVFFNAQRASIDQVSDNLETYDIDADKTGHGEYYLAHRPKDFAAMPDDVDFLKSNHGVNATLLRPEELAAHGLKNASFHGGMHVPLGFGVNPLKYVLGLSQQAQAQSIPIYANTQATKIERDGNAYRIHTPTGQLIANKILFATNGYSTDGMPDALNGWFLPILSNILVTRPLSDDEKAAQGWTNKVLVADTRNLLHYIRLLPDDRLLFGMRGGTGFAPNDIAAMKTRIRTSFESLFPAWAHVETPYFWSGLACLSRSLTAYIGPLSQMENTYTAMAYHGSGVAMGSWSGRQVADIIAGATAPTDIPAPLRQEIKPFPLPSIRRHYLKAAYAWYEMKDR